MQVIAGERVMRSIMSQATVQAKVVAATANRHLRSRIEALFGEAMIFSSA
jgi:hypothetical protein